MITYNIIRETYIRLMRSHVGEKEVNGQNRSHLIDAMNKRAGVPLGSPYCLTGATCTLDDTCKELGLKNPVGVRAGTQSFYDRVPNQYKRMSARKGMIGIFQTRKDHARGHAVVCVEDEDSDFMFKTIEFNTDGKGAREGGGVWASERSASGDTRLSLRGFVDVVQWICDANGIHT